MKRSQQHKKAHPSYQPKMRNVSHEHAEIVSQPTIMERLKPYAIVIVCFALVIVAHIYTVGQASQNAYMDGYRAGYDVGISQAVSRG